jgi:hypothetical protein
MRRLLQPIVLALVLIVATIAVAPANYAEAASAVSATSKTGEPQSELVLSSRLTDIERHTRETRNSNYWINARLGDIRLLLFLILVVLVLHLVVAIVTPATVRERIRKLIGGVGRVWTVSATASARRRADAETRQAEELAANPPTRWRILWRWAAFQGTALVIMLAVFAWFVMSVDS